MASRASRALPPQSSGPTLPAAAAGVYDPRPHTTLDGLQRHLCRGVLALRTDGSSARGTLTKIATVDGGEPAFTLTRDGAVEAIIERELAAWFGVARPRGGAGDGVKPIRTKKQPTVVPLPAGADIGSFMAQLSASAQARARAPEPEPEAPIEDRVNARLQALSGALADLAGEAEPEIDLAQLDASAQAYVGVAVDDLIDTDAADSAMQVLDAAIVAETPDPTPETAAPMPAAERAQAKATLIQRGVNGRAYSKAAQTAKPGKKAAAKKGAA